MTRPRPRCFLSLFHAYVCASIKTFKNEDGDFPLTFKTSGQSWPLIVIPISFQTDVPLKGSKLSPWTKPPLHSEGGMLRTRGRLAQEGWWGAPMVHPHSLLSTRSWAVSFWVSHGHLKLNATEPDLTTSSFLQPRTSQPTGQLLSQETSSDCLSPMSAVNVFIWCCDLTPKYRI